jgi:hypothetical protein
MLEGRCDQYAACCRYRIALETIKGPLECVMSRLGPGLLSLDTALGRIGEVYHVLTLAQVESQLKPLSACRCSVPRRRILVGRIRAR